MPIYPIKCECGFKGDVVAKVEELARHGGKVLCPECGNPAEQDYSAKKIGASCDGLHGKRRDSVEVGANAHEVPKLRRLFGDSGHCWQNDGSVKFESKTDATKFFRKEASLKKAFKAKNEADNAAKPPSGQ